MPAHRQLLTALLEQEAAQIEAEYRHDLATLARRRATRLSDHRTKRRALAVFLGPAAAAFGLATQPQARRSHRTLSDTLPLG